MADQTTLNEVRVVTMTETEVRDLIRRCLDEGRRDVDQPEVLTLEEAAELFRYKDRRSFLRFAKRYNLPFKQLDATNYRFLRSQLMRFLGGK